MEINATSPTKAAEFFALNGPAGVTPNLPNAAGEGDELREAFDSFVGQSFYGQLLSSMRKTVGKAAYFDGGRAEEIFRGQLDQTLSAKMSQANGGELSRAMYELFTLNRG